MKYLVTGSREWSDWDSIAKFVRLLRPGDQVAHGGAPRGADFMVHWMLTDKRASQRRARQIYTYGEDGTIGRKRVTSSGDIDVNVFPANWQRYKPADPEHKNPAGQIRNRWMVRTFRPDVAVYFRADGLSPGTDNCISVCRQAGIRTYSIEEFIESMALEEEGWDE